MIRPATIEDAEYIGRNLRDLDAQEVRSMMGMEPVEAVLASFKSSIAVWVGVLDDKPACIFGYGTRDFVGQVGTPWCLTTPLVEKYPIAFALNTKRVVQIMLKRFETLTGIVDSRYAASIAWLRFAGFIVAGEVVINGVPFNYFTQRR